MPRLTPQSLPKLRFHQGSGQFLVVLSGEWFYLGADPAAARRRYDAEVQKWLARGRQARPREVGPDLTVAGLVERWWAHPDSDYRKHGEPTSEVTIRRPAYRGLARLFGHQPAAAFGHGDVLALQDWWVQRGLCLHTIRQYTHRVRHLFRWGVQQGLVPLEVWSRLSVAPAMRRTRINARVYPRVVAVPEADLERTLAVLSPRDRELVQVQLLTGMRPGEVLRLRPCDIDRSGDVWLYRPGRHKGEHHGHEKVVPIGPRAQAILRDRVGRTPPQSYLYPAVKVPGGHLSDRAYRDVISTGCKRAGVTPWHAHQLRHNAATLVRKRFGLDAAQAVLGHKEADTTQIYASLSVDKAVNVAREIG